jgi:SAM-dependent methyltransferase
MRQAWDFAVQCRQRFCASPRFAWNGKILLDFGTGWARIARCFLRDFDAENIIGVDVDSDLIEVSRRTFPEARFLCCRRLPPLILRDCSVDFIVGFSVFSHLSETACRAWITEFARVLQPGGMAALTTRGRWFFDYARSLQPTDPYSEALAHLFPDFAEAKARYDRGEFVHSNVAGVTGGGALDGTFYGETFIPERYARETYAADLELVEFHDASDQPILFFRKPQPPGGRSRTG